MDTTPESDLVEKLLAMSGPKVPNTCTEAAEALARLRMELEIEKGKLRQFGRSFIASGLILKRTAQARNEARRLATFHWLRARLWAIEPLSVEYRAIEDELRTRFGDLDAVDPPKPEWDETRYAEFEKGPAKESEVSR